MVQKDKYFAPWKDYAKQWGKYCASPGSPSDQAISVYRKFIKKTGYKKGIKILILGATPELRDLVQEFTKEVTLVDINWEMISEMTKLLKKPNNQEIWIKADWLKIPIMDKYFQIVLGDLVLGNVEYNKQSQLLSEVKKVLVPQGYFIQKIQLLPNKWPYTLEQTLNLYKNTTPNKKRAMEAFCDMLNCTYNATEHTISSSRIKQGLRKYFENSKFSHSNKNLNKLLNLIWQRWKPLEKEWSIRTARGYNKLISNHFKILKTAVLKDCYFHHTEVNYPLWFCQKK